MPLHAEKKPIYLAKSIRELNQLANTPTGHQNLRILAKSTQMLLKNASECYLEGDQEKAYVLFMRFFNVVSHIKKSREYNKDKSYYDALIGDNNCKMAIERAEELSKDLNKRYEGLVAIETCKRLDEEEEKKIKLDGMKENIENPIMADSSAPAGWVGVPKLYEWLKDINVSVLLIDARSKDQFDSSHIVSFRDIINMPNVWSGSTAKNIGARLTGSALLCWNKRAEYDIIVICDLETTPETFDEKTLPLAFLKDALVKWDLETKLKNDPLFLMSGYRDWVERFPMYASAPLSEEKSAYSKINKDDPKAILDSIDYDIDLSYLEDFTTKQVIDKNSEDGKQTPSVPVVDRSKKPKSEHPSDDHKNAIQKDVLANGMHPPIKSTNVPVSSANRILKPNVLPNEYDSSFKNSTSFSSQEEEFKEELLWFRSSDGNPQKESENLEKLRKEIMELEERKRKLELEVASMDKQKESEKVKVEASGEHTLSQEKAKQAREVAGLLREKRKLAQELNEMSKQLHLHKNQILCENIANEPLNAKILATSDGVLNLAHNTHHDGHTSTTFLHKVNDRSSSPSTAFSQLKTPSQKPSSQLSTGSNTNISHKSSVKSDEVFQKPMNRMCREHHIKPALQSATSGRASPKRPTVRLDVDTSKEEEAPKSNLKRFHSFPNIAKLSEEDDEPDATSSSDSNPPKTDPQKLSQIKAIQSPTPKKVQPPRVDRSIKPTNSYKSLLEAKVRHFQPLWGSIGLGLTGLRNLGNTCYMNSIVQCLSNCFAFFKYFNDNHYSKDINWSNQDGYRGEVAIEFAVVIKNLWSGQYKAISPYDFRAVVSKFGATFASTQHQDAQELLEFLMNGLNEDLNRVKVKPQLRPQDNHKLEEEVAAEKAWQEFLMAENSIVVDLFRGQYKSRVMCSFCETKSIVFEPFMSLTLQIPESQSKCSLSDCLLHFSNEEKMTGDSKWLCPHCKQKREATKRIVVWRLPQVLIIQLKRFHYQGIWRNKISTNVSFPIVNLDMSRYISGPRMCDSNRNTLYNLFAVCNHYGTLDGGHYTAYCRNALNRNWYKFDDSEVSEISSSSIQSPAAYLLFYAKSGLWPQ